ncbi:MAG: ATP-binding protein [Candidatus Thiodiazotropha taylori]|nr:ATP-binding protein [Candidatus Thiodiazotropha taylori]
MNKKVEDTHQYKMTISLKVLDHLGINLYSNVSAVLTEAVANAWDADAEEVHIVFDNDKKTITISDDGHGMTIADMNDKYLHVGYQRRNDETLNDRSLIKARPVMGRKGLGKLSLFSIAETIVIQSCKDDEAHGLKMHSDKIRSVIEEGEADYYPDSLPADSVTVKKGTTIQLSNLKKSRLGPTVSSIPQRLARRFSVLASDTFRIYIDGDEVTPNDRGDLKTVEFLWNLGDQSEYHKGFTQIKEHAVLHDRLDGWESDRFIRGWIGTARKPSQLNTEAGKLNSIVVMSRGRLFQENILDKINDSRHYTHYLTGQIEADFLDSGPDDIATSDRQRVIEDDERYQAIIVYLKSVLTKVESQWNIWRDEYRVDEVVAEHPIVAQWFEGLPEAWRKHAKKVIAVTAKFDTDDEDEKKILLTNAILSFERLRIKGSANELAEALDTGPEAVMNLFIGLDDMEAALYHDIVRARIDVIKAFQGLVDDNAKENVLQLYLFDHLWLLDPAWERAAGSELMETRLKEEGVIIENLTEKEKLGRVDIKYRTHAGKHIIIELKRAKRKLTLDEVLKQGKLYVSKLKKILLAQGDSSPNVEVIFVIGKPLDDEKDDPDAVKHIMAAISPGSCIVHYDTLIKGALSGYSEYIEKNELAGRYAKIVEQL